MIGKRFSFIILGKHNQAGMSGIVYLFFRDRCLVITAICFLCSKIFY